MRDVGGSTIARTCRACYAALAPQHFLYFLPLPHGHGSLRPTRGAVLTICLTATGPSWAPPPPPPLATGSSGWAMPAFTSAAVRWTFPPTPYPPAPPWTAAVFRETDA